MRPAGVDSPVALTLQGAISMTIYSSKNPLRFYVYAYLRSDGTPYYIGKGAEKRWQDKRHSIAVPKDRTRIVILEDDLTDVGALAIERRMIRWYGRKDIKTGILRNLTDGGDGAAGCIVSPLRNMGSSNPMYGRSAITENNLKWYNRDGRNIYVPEGTQPVGFSPGRSGVKCANNRKSPGCISPDGTVFDSLQAAAKHYSLSVPVIRERIRRCEARTKDRKNTSHWYFSQ